LPVADFWGLADETSSNWPFAIGGVMLILKDVDLFVVLPPDRASRNPPEDPATNALGLAQVPELRP
jgi:hypothetical protein